MDIYEALSKADDIEDYIEDLMKDGQGKNFSLEYAFATTHTLQSALNAIRLIIEEAY